MTTMMISTNRTRQGTELPSATRVALALNALVALVGLAIKFGYAATERDPQFPTRIGRLTNELCYFTIQSNLIVVAVCALLAFGRGLRSNLLRTLRLVALVCIIVTGVVYRVLLAGDQSFTGWALVGDALVHSVSPILYVLTWLVLGPRGWVSGRAVQLVLVYPIAWVAFTLVRGRAIHFYPYGFIDVALHGYVKVFITVAVMMGLALLLAVLARAVDRRGSARSLGSSALQA